MTHPSQFSTDINGQNEIAMTYQTIHVRF